MARFYKEVYGKVFSLFVIMFTASYMLKVGIQGCNEYIELLAVSAFSITFSLFTLFFFGINKDLRGKIICNVTNKIKRK